MRAGYWGYRTFWPAGSAEPLCGICRNEPPIRGLSEPGGTPTIHNPRSLAAVPTTPAPLTHHPNTQMEANAVVVKGAEA